jgi:predicted TIM-barrel fold metal-dependent hydrolase
MRDRDLPAFYQSLGLPGVVDLHVHFMPERVLRKVWAFFDNIDWPIAYKLAEAQRVALLRDLKVLTYPALCYPHKPGMAQWLSEWARDFAARTDGCVSTGTFYPEPGVDRYVREAVEAGTRIFKAHVQVGGYDPRDPLLDPVWGLLAEARIPIVGHCGSGPHQGRFTGPGPIGEVLARHPDLTLVVAHCGLPEYGEFIDLATRYPRVHLDTTMAFTNFTEIGFPFPADLRPRLVDLVDKVVLGTDFPNIPHVYAHQIEVLANLDFGDDWLRSVLYENGRRLLRGQLAGFP